VEEWKKRKNYIRISRDNQPEDDVMRSSEISQVGTFIHGLKS
jgi:hypothetical protein